MANAKKCDRCSDYYDDFTKEYVVNHYSYNGFISSDRTSVTYVDSDSGYKPIPAVDLCPKCYQELLEFLKHETTVR